MPAKPTLSMLSLLLAALPLWAQEAGGLDRAGLAAERARVEARYQAAMQACLSRFAVTACQQAARRERGDALAPLTAREQVLEARDRMDRAEAQRRRTQEKDGAAAADEVRQRQRQLLQPPLPASAAPATAPTAAASRAAASRPDPGVHAREVQRDIALGEQQAQRQRERALQRQRDAQAHREALARRDKEREAQGKAAAAPLPLPTASDIEALPTPRR